MRASASPAAFFAAAIAVPDRVVLPQVGRPSARLADISQAVELALTPPAPLPAVLLREISIESQEHKKEA
jgi:hypothetical protein